MLTVSCVLWVGDFKNRDYHPEHVERLRGLVAKHLDEPYEFVCLTNVHLPVSCETIELVSDLPGWWSKIELFRPGLFTDRVLYLDLDVDIIGDLSDLAHYDRPFAAIQDWQHPHFNSSAMSWTPSPETDLIFTKFKDKYMKLPGGDQAWITDVMRKQDMFETFPSDWVKSYKRNVRGRNPKRLAKTLEDTRVISYNGEPKPWDVE